MYDILLKDVKKAHEFEELIKVFLRPSEFRLFSDDTDNVKVPEGRRRDRKIMRRQFRRGEEDTS